MAANNFAVFAYSGNNTVGDYALITSSAGDTILNSASGRKLRMRINNSNALTVDSAKKVGIGTDDPDNTLTLDGVFQLNPQSGSAKFAMYSDNDKFEINKRSSSGGFQANMFVMNTSGFVGLGATSPSAKLDVNGSALTAYVSISNHSSLGMIGSRNFNSYSSGTYALLMNATST